MFRINRRVLASTLMVAGVAWGAALYVGNDYDQRVNERIADVRQQAYADGVKDGRADARVKVREEVDAAYDEGADQGVNELCTQLGFSYDGSGGCDVDDPPVTERIVEVPVEVEVPADTLNCEGGFVAHDVTPTGEWAYCEPGERPDMVKVNQ